METELKNCKVILVEGISSKNQRPYKYLKIRVGDYQFPDTIWINRNTQYVLTKEGAIK